MQVTAVVDADLNGFLERAELSRLSSCLSSTTLRALRAYDRVSLLSALRSLGVTALKDRQAFANALSRAEREGLLPAPAVAPPVQSNVEASISQQSDLSTSQSPLSSQPLIQSALAACLPRPDMSTTPSTSLADASPPDVSEGTPVDNPTAPADDEESRLLRRFEAFHRRHAWKRLEAVENVFATSDLHTEAPANWEFLQRLEPRPSDALIVAGDAATGTDKLEQVLRLLVGKFKYVFYCCGNHELWSEGRSAPGVGQNGVEKLLALMELATSLGAHAAPALLGGTDLADLAGNGNGNGTGTGTGTGNGNDLGAGGGRSAPRAAAAAWLLSNGLVAPPRLDNGLVAPPRLDGSQGVAIVPMQSWYQPSFADGRGYGSADAEGMGMSRMMDAAVAWPTFLRDPARGPARCSEFFARLNEFTLRDASSSALPSPGGGDGGAANSAAAAAAAGVGGGGLLRGWPVISFSHFLPRPELHRGYAWLTHFEGSHALGRQLDELYAAANGKWGGILGRCTHIFGHTHFSIDKTIDGVRYVQHPLGNPHERQNGWQVHTSASHPFACVWKRPMMSP